MSFLPHLYSQTCTKFSSFHTENLLLITQNFQTQLNVLNLIHFFKPIFQTSIHVFEQICYDSVKIYKFKAQDKRPKCLQTAENQRPGICICIYVHSLRLISAILYFSLLISVPECGWLVRAKTTSHPWELTHPASSRCPHSVNQNTKSYRTHKQLSPEIFVLARIKGYLHSLNFT